MYNPECLETQFKDKQIHEMKAIHCLELIAQQKLNNNFMKWYEI